MCLATFWAMFSQTHLVTQEIAVCANAGIDCFMCVYLMITKFSNLNQLWAKNDDNCATLSAKWLYLRHNFGK
jgi:hypothetical protein